MNAEKRKEKDSKGRKSDKRQDEFLETVVALL